MIGLTLNDYVHLNIAMKDGQDYTNKTGFIKPIKQMLGLNVKNVTSILIYSR